MVNFEALVDEGVIAPDDLNLFRFCETADEAWTYLCEFYADSGQNLDCVK